MKHLISTSLHTAGTDYIVCMTYIACILLQSEYLVTISLCLQFVTKNVQTWTLNYVGEGLVSHTLLILALELLLRAPLLLLDYTGEGLGSIM